VRLKLASTHDVAHQTWFLDTRARKTGDSFLNALTTSSSNSSP
jgi:hypothetical protein